MTRRWLLLLLTLLSLLSLGAGLLAYTGPAPRNNLSLSVVWRTTCWSTQYPGFPPVWRYRTWDNVYAPEGSPNALLWQASYPETPNGASCYAGLEGTHGWMLGTINNAAYPPATLAPTFSCTLPGNAGWCRSGSFNLAGNEPIPGELITMIEADLGALCALNSATGSCAWSPADGEASLLAWATSSFGDTSLAQTLAWKIDRTAPLLTVNLPVPDGQNGWYIAAPTLTLAASDATSGLAAANFGGGGYSVTVSADGVMTLTATAQDVAGNTSAQNVTILKDSTPPMLSIPTAPDGQNGWYITQPTLTLNASDAASGLASASFEGGGQTVTLTDGVSVLTATASDNAGNTWAVSETVQVDTQAPIIAPALATAPALNGWHTSAVTIAANASDATSGLALVEYRLDGSAWQSGSSVTVASEGEHTVEFRATDVAGNRATSMPENFRLDLTPPASAFANPPEGGSTRISGLFTFSGVSTDLLSGLAAAEISLDDGATWQPLTLSDGHWSYTWDTRAVLDGSYTILARADDRAGNRENTARVQVIVGNQPPRVELQTAWWLWEAGRLRLRVGEIPIQSVTVHISCSPWHHDLILHYTAETVPTEIQWDRRCGEGAYAAESGDYPVTVTACDAWERCTEDSGVIRVPFVAPPGPTGTPTALPTTEPSPTARPTQPAPTPTIAPAVLPAQEPAAEPLTAPPPAPEAWLWSLLTLPGLWLVFSLNSLTDPRPAALRRLGQTLKKVCNPKK